jgi:lipopolysaccharide biosynthesis glycosyltransferase
MGVDNLRMCRNCDFDLKRDRAFQLYRLGIVFQDLDICEEQLTLKHTEQNGLVCVIHVVEDKQMISDLDTFDIRQAICFIKFIEDLVGLKRVHIVHIISSLSVQDTEGYYSSHSYLQNFHTLGRVVRTKLLTVFCQTRNISHVDINVVNAFGPWGRHDTIMSLLSGKKNPKDIQRMRIWLTSVSDIIASVLRALKFKPVHCGRTLLVKPSHHVFMDQTVELLMRHKRKEASFGTTYNPLDTETTSMPVSSLENDVRLYSVWLAAYEELFNNITSSEWHIPSQQFMERVNEEKHRRLSEQRNGILKKHNMQLKQQQNEMRQKFLDFAMKTDIRLPKLSKKKFIYYPGKDSPGYDIMRLPHLQSNITALMERCKEVNQCIAFNTKGLLKKQISNQKKWVKMEGDKAGLYIADIDICQADLHTCHSHSTCHFTGPAHFKCLCDNGYWGTYCKPQYGSVGPPKELEDEEKMTDEINGVDWTELKKNAEFVFFPSMDSPGGDYLIADKFKQDASKLKTACMKTRRCLAFNTNGILKSALRWSTKWMQWTDSQTQGLYVLDLDYCSLDEMDCPEHAHCQKLSPANYSCLCEPGFQMVTEDLKDMCRPIEGHKETSRTEDGYVHVILSADVEHYKGLVVAMRSILENSLSPETVYFHVVVVGETADSLREFLSCHGIYLQDQLDVQMLDELQLVQHKIKVHASPQVVGNLASKANFARFYFHKIFTRLRKALYVDSDVVVQQDIGQLWQIAMKSDAVFAAVKRKSPPYGQFFGKPVKDVFKQRYGYVFQDTDPTFNAGVYAIDLSLWEKNNFLNDVYFWMNQNSERRLWSYGTQPILLLTLHKQWTELPEKWNVQGLGYNNKMTSHQLDNGALLHWSGKRKPWLKDGLYKEYWLKYNSECSGHGQCVKSQKRSGGWWCRCESGFSGEFCKELV